MQRRFLVSFYSRTGNTRHVALAIARALDAAVEEVVDARDRSGKWGWLVANIQATLGSLTEIKPSSVTPESYDVLVVGTPVWNSSLSTPMRTFLALHKGRLPEVAFFLTHGGTGRARVFRQMARCAGREPVATLAVKARRIREDSAQPLIERFVDSLRAQHSGAVE